MDYKNMSADELIHLISNKALNKTMNENDKLIIQDCCKELYKKKETIKKYRKITYVHSKVFSEPSIHSVTISTKVKTKIVKIVDFPGELQDFPEELHCSILEKKWAVISDECEECEAKNTYTILKIEDI